MKSNGFQNALDSALRALRREQPGNASAEFVKGMQPKAPPGGAERRVRPGELEAAQRELRKK